LNVNIYIIYNI